jgi:hypothetical protein
MGTKSATIHWKMPMPARQLPITGFAHKAGIVGDADLTAVNALLDVTTECRCPARLDRAHNPTLPVG